MIALYKRDTEVAFRPGLELEKCRCLMACIDRKLDRFVTVFIIRYIHR